MSLSFRSQFSALMKVELILIVQYWKPCWTVRQPCSRICVVMCRTKYNVLTWHWHNYLLFTKFPRRKHLIRATLDTDNLRPVIRLARLADKFGVSYSSLLFNTVGQNSTASHQLSLALVWNRADIARSEIFTDKQKWKVKLMAFLDRTTTLQLTFAAMNRTFDPQ